MPPVSKNISAVLFNDRLNQQWIGVDQPAMAVKVTEVRLQKQADLFSSPYTVRLHKYDYDTLRYKDAFQFEAVPKPWGVRGALGPWDRRSLEP
jgi:hypothetical protein